jgi:type II secretory pathway pseudopilin PulG
MTLMELIVGIVITGAMAAIGAAAFNSIIEHRRVIVEASVDTERASALREMLRQWVGSASIQITSTTAAGARQVRTFGPAGSQSISRTQISLTGAATGSAPAVPAITSAASTGDELSFVTSALTPVGTPRTRVRLFIDGDPVTTEQGLTIEYQASTATPLQRMQLDSTIVAMTVEFLDRTTNRWYPYSEASTITPIAVRLWFPPVEDVYVPPLLQYPLLFVIGQTAAQQQSGRGGGP